MIDGTGPVGGERRRLFRSAIDRWLGHVVERTEKRIARRQYFRPPGALPEVGFLAACTRCGACADVCPSSAIMHVRAEGGLAAGTPYIDPGVQPCTVCPDMPCASVCPTDALTVPPALWEGYRIGRLELVAERCITFKGTPCGVCAEACPVGPAALAIDEGGHPVIRSEGCVGCGLCVRACVTSPSSFVLTYAEG
ncbi:MAG: 4Fe-4S dicluster domain-containing protein [Gemmatimonadales bacterium]|nr:4Fe-4S dicluster domain-containing protein [Gemmatimonadales bacterium]